MTIQDDDKNRDKIPRFDIRTIVFLIVQSGAIFWWAAGQTHTSQDAIRRIELIETHELNMEVQQRSVGERLAHLEERTTDQLHTLERIEDILREQHRR